MRTELLPPRRFFLVACGTLLSNLILASCTTAEQTFSEIKTNQKTETAGTGGKLVSIQSDNVRAAGYDANSKIMTVQFNNGYTYEYYGIPLELWDSFIAAQPNPWTEVGYPYLVKAGYAYRRIS